MFAECHFVDPVADIAVLGPSDDDEPAEQFEKFTEAIVPITVGLLPPKGWPELDGWMLSPGGEWFYCSVNYDLDSPPWTANHAQELANGMSGSQILTNDGCAIGELSCSNDRTGDGGPHARLSSHLPVWLLRGCRQPVRARPSKDGRRKLGELRQRRVASLCARTLHREMAAEWISLAQRAAEDAAFSGQSTRRPRKASRA